MTLDVILRNSARSQEWLDEVVAEMRILGIPTVKYVTHQGRHFALYGSHRLMAAKILGIVPRLVELPYDHEAHAGKTLEEFARSHGDWDLWCCGSETMADIVADAGRPALRFPHA
jgi:hypothetical protein